MKEILTDNLINVDGVELAIRWSEVRKGSSFFIPCVHTRDVVRQVRKIFKRKGWNFKHQVKIENTYFGVRFWRTM